jgi:hypothetical protein
MDYNQIRPLFNPLTYCDFFGECSCEGIAEQADKIFLRISADRDAPCSGVCRGQVVNATTPAFQQCLSAPTTEKKTRSYITSQFYLRGRCDQDTYTTLEDSIMQSVEL